MNKKSISPPKKYLYLISFLFFLSIAIFIMNYLQLILKGTTMILGVDIYPRWVGAQAVLNGISPYSLETRRQIWLSIYGSTNIPTGNPFGFYYPPAIITILLPWILLGVSSANVAIVWCALIFALFAAFLFASIDSIKNFITNKWIIPVLLISGLFFRPAFSNYLLGQFALFSVLMAVFAWRLFENNKPVLAGVLCSLSLVKPSITIIPIFLLLFYYRHKVKGLISFILFSLLLYIPPTIMLGWWIPDFLKDISRYSAENRVAWSWLDIGSFSGMVWLFLSLILIRFGNMFNDKPLLLSASLAFNALFAPHTADYDLVAFVPLLLYLGYFWFNSDKNKAYGLAVYMLLLWAPWLSLIFMIVFQVHFPSSVEAWYRLIWLVYPNIVLIPVLITKIPINFHLPIKK